MIKIKNEYLKYIKKFSKITITMACEKAGVDRGNLLNGKASKEKTLKVKQILESEVAKLYLFKEDEASEENTTL